MTRKSCVQQFGRQPQILRACNREVFTFICLIIIMLIFTGAYQHTLSILSGNTCVFDTSPTLTLKRRMQVDLIFFYPHLEAEDAG